MVEDHIWHNIDLHIIIFEVDKVVDKVVDCARANAVQSGR